MGDEHQLRQHKLPGRDLNKALMVSLPGMSLPGMSLPEVDPLEVNPLEVNPLEVNPLEANPLEANFLEANLHEAKCAQETRQARLMLREKECRGWHRIDQHHPRIIASR